ncbi:FAD-binding oxidoreductase [Arhodomonas sp. SL1]|uniref:FAD-binding oxidoreductase n=1 Tax=Arhodomonas sp. SL1 TaxID=3425691 RepID=UPI003F8819F7
MSMTDYLQTVRNAVGDDRVDAADAANERYGASTEGGETAIAGAIRPASVADVQTCLQLAQCTGVPVYPVSTGHNWGYGCARPVTHGCVVLDLAGLNRIRDCDEELGVVTVEPGVTQAQLHAYLRERQLPFMVPVTGAGPSCSIAANALERGYGITPYTDHFAAVTAIEAVLPTGALYRSTLTEMGGEEVDRLFKWGIGPYLDGLFAQSGYAVVVSTSVALAWQPERLAAFYFAAREHATIEDLVPAVSRVLRELGGTVPAINILNPQRMLSMLAPFPADEAEDGVLPREAVARLSRHHGIEAWNGVGSIQGSREVVNAARRSVRRILKPATSRFVFITHGRLDWIERGARMVPKRFGGRARRLAGTLRASLNVMGGDPSEVALPLAYWRSGVRPPAGTSMNPARDGCGLIWYAPLVPMRGEAVQRYLRLLEEICPQYGLNPLVTLTTLNDRCFDSTVPLLFDRADPRAVARAHEGYRALLEAGRCEGFLPYRLHTGAMDLLPGLETVSMHVSNAIKQVLDPGACLAPGRYLPPRPAGLDTGQ